MSTQWSFWPNLSSESQCSTSGWDVWFLTCPQVEENHTVYLPTYLPFGYASLSPSLMCIVASLVTWFQAWAPFSASLSPGHTSTHLWVLLLWPKKCISWFPSFPPLLPSAVRHPVSLPYPSSQCSLRSKRKLSALCPQIFHSFVLSGDFQDVVDGILSVIGQIWMHVAIL